MAAKRDFYEVLGIDKNADEATIKKAYRKLAKKYHPDMNKGNPNAEKIFQEVTEAYEVLGDPKKRKLYDEYGPISLEAGFDPEKMKQAQYGNPFGNGGFYQSYSSGEPGSGYQEFHFDGSSDMDDILDKLFGKKGGFHGTGGFGGRSGFGSTGEFGSGFGGVHEERGQNIETEVPISFEEAVFGCDKRFTLSSSDGKSQNFEVHIPAGIGVLEAVFIAMLSGEEISRGAIIAALLAWRALFYFLPLLLATLCYLILESRAKHLREKNQRTLAGE